MSCKYSNQTDLYLGKLLPCPFKIVIPSWLYCQGPLYTQCNGYNGLIMV